MEATGSLRYILINFPHSLRAPQRVPPFIGISSFSPFKIKASNASCFQSEKSLLIPGCMTDRAGEIAMRIAFSGN